MLAGERIARRAVPGSEEIRPAVGQRSAVDEAKEFLVELLTTGEQSVKVISSEAKLAGIAPRTLDRAKAALGVRSRRVGFGKKSYWVWVLPDPKSAKSANPECWQPSEKGAGEQEKKVNEFNQDRQEEEDKEVGGLRDESGQIVAEVLQ